ncbi:hypothetical protein QZH41_013984 [Actinostola sp. cb2023]|nr:hypothetical protein QZH41_013984 [Actinostola sp. cb2023]
MLTAHFHQVGKELSLPRKGWTLYKNRNKTEKIENSSRKTLDHISIKCHHGDHSKCIHCVPLEPYNETYLKEHDPPIKHMSFHAYLKKISHGTNKCRLKELQSTQQPFKKQADAISAKDEEEMWSQGILGTHCPDAVLNALMFLSGKLFVLRGGKEQRELSHDQFVLEKQKENGLMLVIFKEKVSKTNQGGLKRRKVDRKEVRHVEDPTSEKSFTFIYNFYISKCPETVPVPAFYLRPKAMWKYSDQVWFEKSPMGHNTIDKRFKKMCNDAGLEGNFSNHSGRVTGITRMYQAGLPEKLIMNRSGHRSIEGVRAYQRENPNDVSRVSHALSSPATVEFQKNAVTTPKKTKSNDVATDQHDDDVMLEYRHVDNILFENPSIVEPFLDYWRKTGNQRIGFLVGRYEHHKEVPLGIRAVVVAIYEPPQECTPDSVELVEDTNIGAVQQLAAELGLQVVGWIFTDLVPEDVKKGTVKQLRGIDTHFLTAEECVMAGDFQNQFASTCRFAATGKFGSKFVTVVVSGHEGNQIGFDGYQVSNQCMALVRDECLVPTIDEPGLGYIRESTSHQYVPDVFYKDKDSYNNEVTMLARPMPIEYVLVQVAAAFPVDSLYTFPRTKNGAVFPIEHRENIGECQNIDAVMKHLNQHPTSEFLLAMSNFHLLIFLATSDMLPTKNRLAPLCEAIKNQDIEALDRWRKGEHWRTVEEIIAAHDYDGFKTSPYLNDIHPDIVLITYPGPTPGQHSHPAGDVDMEDVSQQTGSSWTCKHCTFINQYRESCEMCGLPRN